jgi:glutathione synthase
MKFLHLMDPIESIDITKDTTFAFIRECQARDHENWYCHAGDLVFEDGQLWVDAAPLQVKEVQGEHATLGDRSRRLANDFGAIFMRKDPPFDTEFFFTTQLLSLVDERKTFVFNNPSGLREASEKVFILRYPDLIADTMISSSSATILKFRDRVGGDIVVKPLDGCAGAGIFRIADGDLNTHSILETVTIDGTRAIMAQRYLPESRQGDMRLLYLNGKALAAIQRVPRGDDLRGNIHVGGRVEAAEIGEREHEICARLAPALDKLGIYFAGLDVIGRYLTEVNVTSPTGIQEANRLAGQKFEAAVIDLVEAKVNQLPG